MLKYKLYRISADNGKTYTEQYLTQQDADEQKENFGYIVEPASTMWDTANVMDQIVRRARQIEKKQNPATARDFLEEIRDEIERLIPPAAPEESANLRVCYHCLLGIESHEGRQFTRPIYLDDDEPARCEWCDDDVSDILYEFL